MKKDSSALVFFFVFQLMTGERTTVKQQKHRSRRSAIFCTKVKTSFLFVSLLEAVEPAGAAALMLDCLRRPFFSLKRLQCRVHLIYCLQDLL